MLSEKTITTRATSGTIVNNFRTGYRVQISWSVNSQNIANNTSNVTVKAQLVATSSGYYISSTATKYGSLTINGTTYNFTFSAGLSGGQTKTVFTKTVDIPHNADGSKTFSMSTTLGIKVTLSGVYWGDVSASGSGVLNSIPRTSSISLSASSINAGSSITVNISRAHDSFTHKVYYSFGSKSVTISTNATTSAAYTIPLDHCTVIPNSTSGTATISVDTYNGSTYIGSASKNFTINVPSTVKPTLSSLSAAVVADGASTSFGYVKGRSKVKLTINGAAGSQGSTISRYSISGGGFSSSSSSFTTTTLNTSGSITFTATVTDSRGRQSDAKTVTITVNDYAPPVILYPTVYRCDSSGSPQNEGTYIKVSFEYSNASIVNGKVTHKIEYKASSSTTWTNAGTITSDRGLVFGSGGISTSSSYDVRITLQDTISTVTQIFNVPAAFVTMDFKKGGRGIAIGKASETDNLFDVGIDTTVRGQVNANAFNFNGFKDWDTGSFDATGGGAAIVNDNGTYKSLMLLGNRSAGGNRKIRMYDDVLVSSNLEIGATIITNKIDCRGYIQLPGNGGSWLSGTTNATIRGSKQSPESFHPILSQTTSSNHKIALGGLGNDFGFYFYDASRTENGFDNYFKFMCNTREVESGCVLNMGNHIKFWNNNALLFASHGGGWYMQDSSWIRAYNDKSIYTGATIKAGNALETRYFNSTGGNLDINARGATLFINTNSSSGANININSTWSGSSGTEPSVYNSKGGSWGFLGNSGTAWFRVYGYGGSVSDRNRKYHITKALEEEHYENVKNLNFYNYRTISSRDIDEKEMAMTVFKNPEFTNDDRSYKTESIDFNGIVYEEISSELTQDEIKEERIKQIIEKNPNFKEHKREDLMLGAMIDELPTEVTFYDNEGGDGKAVDMYSYTSMVAGATKHLINKVEALEKENEELKNRLDKMEEILNGIINRE